MSDINRTNWKKVDKGMKDKVLKTNDIWKALTEEKKIAFCKYLKEKQKVVSKLAKLFESNILTFGDSVRQHLRNFCNDNGSKPEAKAKAEKRKAAKKAVGPSGLRKQQKRMATEKSTKKKTVSGAILSTRKKQSSSTGPRAKKRSR